MKFKKNFKKGFTLVELIVVIAIVAILAAVSVVSYIAFINSANESADIQLVKQLNIALQADESLNGPRDTMHEMLEAMEDNGFVVENLTKTKSGYDIVWDQTNNRFGLIKADNSLVYGESTYNANVYHTKWKFADTQDEVEDQEENKEYSIYLTEEFAKTPVTELTVNAGLDAGNYSGLKNISYINASSSHSVVIRTNGGTLTVGSSAAVAKGQIWHYGTLDKAIIYTENTCFHTHGKIADMDLKAGKAIAEDKGYVALLKASAGTLVEEKDSGVFYIPSDVTTETVNADVAATLGYTVTSTGTTASEARTEKLASTVYEIANKFDLIAFRDSVNSGNDFAGMSVKLTDNIDMAGYNWLTSIGVSNAEFAGTFDGGNHFIYNLSNGGRKTTEEFSVSSTGATGTTFGLFGKLKGTVAIKNLTLTVNAVSSTGIGWGGVVGVANGKPCDLTLEGLTVKGTLYGQDKVAGIIAQAPTYNDNSSLVVRNCVNEATITGTRCAGIAGCINTSNGNTFVNCVNKGDLHADGIYSTAAGILVKNEEGTVFTNCSNEGAIEAKIAYNVATNLFIQFVNQSNNFRYESMVKPGDEYYYTVNSKINVEKRIELFVGGAYSESTAVDWEEVIRTSGHSESGDYTGWGAGIWYDQEHASEYVVTATLNKPNSSTESYSTLRYFKSLDEALSHGVNGTVRLSTNQSIGYTLSSGKGSPSATEVQPSSLHLDLNNTTLSVTRKMFDMAGGAYTVSNGTIQFNSSENFANLTDGATVLFNGVTLNNPQAKIVPTYYERNGEFRATRINFDANSNITCYIDLGTNEKNAIIINGVDYLQTGGQYIVITNNVLAQSSTH